MLYRGLLVGGRANGAGRRAPEPEDSSAATHEARSGYQTVEMAHSFGGRWSASGDADRQRQTGSIDAEGRPPASRRHFASPCEACQMPASVRSQRPVQQASASTIFFRAHAQLLFFVRRQALGSNRRGFTLAQQLALLVIFGLVMLCAIPRACATFSLDPQPHDVMLSIAMPRSRRLLHSGGATFQQAGVKYCARDAVATGRAPLAWFYAAPEGGLPEYGAPQPSLITAGYADAPYVNQWQGACGLPAFAFARMSLVTSGMCCRSLWRCPGAGNRWPRPHDARRGSLLTD